MLSKLCLDFDMKEMLIKDMPVGSTGKILYDLISTANNIKHRGIVVRKYRRDFVADINSDKFWTDKHPHWDELIVEAK